MIERTANKCYVTINTSRPGFVKGKKGSDEYRTFSYGKDPETGQPRYLETIGPLEKDANMIILNSIAKTISDLSTGALEMSNGLTVYQN